MQLYTDARLRTLAALAFGLWAAIMATAARPALPAATDLAADGAQARAGGGSVVVLFTIEGCRYCETVKRRYLEPLMQDPAWQGRVLVREVNASLSAPLRDFEGMATNHARYAAFQGVQLYPTVRFFGPDGVRRAPDIVGQVIDDFYWAYLSEAVGGKE